VKSVLIACALCAGCGGGAGADAAGSDAAATDAGAGLDSGGGGADSGGLGADAGEPPIACVATVAPGAPGEPFGAPVMVSDATRASDVPSMAVRGDRVLFAWQEFDDMGVVHVVYALAESGCVGARTSLDDTFAPARRPAVAATGAGWVIAYAATDAAAGVDVLRALEVDAAGVPRAPAETLSAPGSYAAWPHAASWGDDEAFAWTDGSAHWFAIRGPRETVPAALVGTTLQSTGLLNYPRIALAPDGTLHLAYRDGGASAVEWDALLVTRPPGGTFGAPVNVSNSAGLGTDSQDVFMEPDGTLDVVYADQDPANICDFVVRHATRDPSGAVSAPVTYAGQPATQAWGPVVGPGLAAVWSTGAGPSGPLYYTDGSAPAASFLPGTTGRSPDFAVGEAGTRHLVYVVAGFPSQVFYAFGAD